MGSSSLLAQPRRLLRLRARRDPPRGRHRRLRHRRKEGRRRAGRGGAGSVAVVAGARARGEWAGPGREEEAASLLAPALRSLALRPGPRGRRRDAGGGRRRLPGGQPGVRGQRGRPPLSRHGAPRGPSPGSSLGRRGGLGRQGHAAPDGPLRAGPGGRDAGLPEEQRGAGGGGELPADRAALGRTAALDQARRRRAPGGGPGPQGPAGGQVRAGERGQERGLPEELGAGGPSVRKDQELRLHPKQEMDPAVAWRRLAESQPVITPQPWPGEGLHASLAHRSPSVSLRQFRLFCALSPLPWPCSC